VVSRLFLGTQFCRQTHRAIPRIVVVRRVK
jgi:hypothetical protein